MSVRSKKTGRAHTKVQAETKKPVQAETFEEDAIGEVAVDPVPVKNKNKPEPPKVETPKFETPKVEAPKPEIIPRDDNIDEEEPVEEPEEPEEPEEEQVEDGHVELVEQVEEEPEEPEEEPEEEPLAAPVTKLPVTEVKSDVKPTNPDVKPDVKPTNLDVKSNVKLEDSDDDSKPLLSQDSKNSKSEPKFYDKYTRGGFGFDIKIGCSGGKTLCFSSYCMSQYPYFKAYFLQDSFDGTHVDLSTHSVEAVGAILRYMDPFVATKVPGLIDMNDVSDMPALARGVINLAGSWEGFKEALSSCYAILADNPTSRDLETLKAYDDNIYRRASTKLIIDGDLSTASRVTLYELIGIITKLEVLSGDQQCMLIRILKAWHPSYGLNQEEIKSILGFGNGPMDLLPMMYILAWSSNFVRAAIGKLCSTDDEKIMYPKLIWERLGIEKMQV